MFNSEVELCNVVKNSNLFPGFTLHEEVGTDMNGNSCDMVYEKDGRVYCIEAKTQFNFDVVAQAIRWRDKATNVYIAIPASVKLPYDGPKIKVVNALEIGVIRVSACEAFFYSPGHNPFPEGRPYYQRFMLEPRQADMAFWRDIFASKLENSTPAGSQHGERSTPFTRSLCALKAQAIAHPEMTLKELVASVSHHWAHDDSAIHALNHYAKRGIIEKFWKF